jgi:putative transposase
LFWSLCYLMLRRALQLAALRFRSEEFKELEIVVLRHQLAVLRRQAGRPELTSWVTQQARQLAWGLAERSTPVRFLIRDRDSKFTRDFDVVFRSEGIEIVRTPLRAPKANAIAERFVRTVRAECLDWLLILNRRHLERVLRIFVDHHNGHRPYRALNLVPPDQERPRPRVATPSRSDRVERRDRLGGLIHEYGLAA